MIIKLFGMIEENSGYEIDRNDKTLLIPCMFCTYSRVQMREPRRSYSNNRDSIKRRDSVKYHRRNIC